MRDTFNPREEYVGIGTEDTYSFDFKITNLSHVLVIKTNVAGEEVFKVRGTDTTHLDTVTFDALKGGGTIVLNSAVETDYGLAIILADDEPLQTSEFKDKGDFGLSRIESALDALSGQIQRMAYLFKRTPKTSETVVDADIASFDYSIPNPIGNGGKVLAVKSDESGFEWIDN